MRQAVKSAPGRAGRRARLVLVTGCLLSVPSGAQVGGPLFGGTGQARREAAPRLDPELPKGPRWQSTARPRTTGPRACSSRRPACVHHTSQPTEIKALSWVGALETAYDLLVLGLGAPPPRSDYARGGGPEFDVYLSPDAAGPAIHADHWSRLDRDTTSAFCTVGADHDTMDRAATLCLAEAIAFRLDAAETPHTRRALATYLWWLTGTPTAPDAEAIDTVQSHPERAIIARDRTELSEGAALFYAYLDAKYGSAIAEVPLVTHSLSAKEASPVGWRWHNEPDLLDVLRETFGRRPNDWARLLGDFAVARAFIGGRDTEGRLPLLAWCGSFGRVRFEWSVLWSSLPRRLAPVRPIEPTGSSYVWLELDEPAEGHSLGFRADWESPVAFKWVLVLVDEAGRELRRVDVPYLERSTQVERTVVRLEGAAGVIVAGINVGDLSPTYPFDPDFSPYEPHGYTVYLAKL